MKTAAIILLALALPAAACSNMTDLQQRALSGGAIGAAGGAAIGAITGTSVLTGALIGTGAGAAAGALSSEYSVQKKK